ncbi:MAG: hypothetical protein MZV64_60060 [Ignavibacteriales bacterium]|nr:hypothetical protein [Ignavibacteriales bacterium]
MTTINPETHARTARHTIHFEDRPRPCRKGERKKGPWVEHRHGRTRNDGGRLDPVLLGDHCKGHHRRERRPALPPRARRTAMPVLRREISPRGRRTDLPEMR